MIRACIGVVACIGLLTGGTAPAIAGALAPPGPPAPTMKTLNEVEARIPIGPLTTPGDATAVHVISQPGSYYLTGSVVGAAGLSGIRITASDVTLDLNGYSLVGAGGVSGVTMPQFQSNITISNGVVRGWAADGITLRADNSMVERIRFDTNGHWGISNMGSYGGRVAECVFIYNGYLPDVGGGGANWSGAIISDCHAVFNGGAGLQGAMVRGCVVEATSADTTTGEAGDGIVADLVESCIARGNDGRGVVVSRLARGCMSVDNGTAYAGPFIVDSY
jgi:hypothetical protein